MRCQRVACFTLSVALSMVLTSAAAARAQTAPATQAAGVPELMRGNQRVWVTAADGRVVTGKLVVFSASRVVVRKDGADTSIAFGDVRRIDVPDLLDNGIRIGAITGAVLYGGMSIAFVQGFCDHDCAGGAVFVVFSAGFGAALGAGMGALIDHLHKNREAIYIASSSSPSVRFAPLLTPTRAGMGVSVRWR